MTELPNRVDPDATRLKADLQALNASLADFQHALFGVNDEHLVEAFRAPLDVAARLLDLHGERATATIADDAAHLRSLFARHPIPREDPALGPLDSLTRVRSARGALLADIDEVLAAADAVGLRPRDPALRPPTTVQFDRSGMVSLFIGMERRLGQVEVALQELRLEGRREPDHTPQQVSLVNFFADNIAVEVALARLEAATRNIVDFASLTRAVEAMAELTRDFVLTVRAMRDKVTHTLYDAANEFRPLVRRVVGGLKAIVHHAKRPVRLGGGPVDPTPPPDQTEDSSQSAGEGPADQPWLPQDKAEIAEADALIRLLGGIFACSEDVANEILGRGEVRYYPAESTILRLGERTSTIFLVARGCARALVQSPDGRQILLEEFRRGDLFGAPASAEPVLQEAEIVAEEDVDLFLLEGSDLMRLSADHPQVVSALLEAMMHQLRNATSRMDEHAPLSAVGRVYAELLRQARQRSDMTIRPSPIHAELAMRLSVPRETVTRAMSALEQRGIIRRDKGALIIIAANRLEQLVI